MFEEIDYYTLDKTTLKTLIKQPDCRKDTYN